MSIEEPPWLFSESTWIQQGKPSGQVQEKAQKAVTYEDVQSLMSGYSDRQRIRGLLRDGQKISAITFVRERTNATLFEAKKFIDSFEFLR
jgi:ribosomal protein L7/L12